MGEGESNHRRLFEACPELVEGAAMILRLPPHWAQRSMSKTRLRCLAQLIRAGAPCACACSLESLVAGSE